MDTLLDQLLDDEFRYKLFMYQILMIYKRDVEVVEVAQQVNLSDRKVRMFCNDLNSDFLTLNLRSKVKFASKSSISSTQFSQLDYQELRRHYFESSILSNLLMQVGILQKFTISEFAKLKFISKSKAYANSKSLNVLLKNWNIYMKSSGLSGSEINIRSFCFQVIYYFYNVSLSNLPSVLRSHGSEINTFINSIQIIYQTIFRTNQDSQLRVLLEISWLRLESNHWMELPGNNSLNREFYANFVKLIPVKNSLSTKKLEQEARYIFSFLTLNNYLPKHINDEVEETTTYQLFIEQMLKKFPLFFDKISLQTVYKLKKICYRWEYLAFSLASFMSQEQFSFFQQSFPRIHESIYDFIMILHRNKKGGLLDYEKAHLYYDLIFCILSDQELQTLEKTVHIFIDFSGGEDYNQFISMNVQAFKYLSLVIDDKLTAKTDLYLSDFYSGKVVCEQIIWKNPPLEYDWKEFADKVVEIRGSD